MTECMNTKHEHKGKSSEKFLNKKDLIGFLNISEGDTILDAGCGNGYMTKEFATLVKDTGKVYAVDVDKAAIQSLRFTLKTNVIEAFVGDITTKIKLKASTIDLIYLSTVMHGFSKSQIQGFISETQRLLKPNGLLAILEIKKEDTPFGPPQNIRISPEELNEIIPLTPKKIIAIGEYFYLQLYEK